MSKWKVIVIVLVLVLTTNGLQFFIQYKSRTRLEEMMTQEISSLNTTIAEYGPRVTCYSVAGTVKAGDEITEDSLAEMSIPESVVSEDYIQDPGQIVGKYYKISVNPYTPITTEMVMEEELDDTVRDRDIVLCNLSVGTLPGDYIDIRITYPYGEDYVVLPHKRIVSINENTIKMYLNEAEWHIYQGAMVDYWSQMDKGAVIYGARYLEPGVQEIAESYYSVPENIKAMIILDPNIFDKALDQVNDTLRKGIDRLLNSSGEEGDDPLSGIGGGRADWSTRVTDDQQRALEDAYSDDEEGSFFDDEEELFGGSSDDEENSDEPEEEELE